MYVCIYIYIYIYRCLGGGGGTFWLLYESLTFKGPEALQATAVNRIGVTKIAPNFDTHFATYIQGVPGGKDLTSGECSLGQTIPI